MKKIILFTALALVLAACSSTKETSNAPAANAPANTSTNAAPEKAAVKEETYTAGKDARADLISSTQKLQKLPFWSAVITISAVEGERAEMQFSAPDNYRIKKADGEIIVAAGNTYSKVNGKWEKTEDNIGKEIKEQTQAGVDEGIRNLKDVTITGNEKFNGRDTTVYTHKMGPATVKIWIATDSGLQLKNETEMEAMGKLQKQTIVYDYETPVKIEAPKID